MATAPTTSSTAIYERGMDRAVLSAGVSPELARHGCWPPGVAELHYADFLATT